MIERPNLLIEPLLEVIAQQADRADETRSVTPEVIEALKASDVMRLSASVELGGLGARIRDIAEELEAAAPACGSTSWCLWNHLCTFHLFCGLMGPDNVDLLRGIVANHEWVCFPAGASTAVRGAQSGEGIRLEGVAAFGSGSRYAEWAGVSFMPRGRDKPQFTLIDLRKEGVRIDPTWQALSLRASATDHVHYEGVEFDASRAVDFPAMYRVQFRKPNFPIINHRYREDWVALSDLWLGAMAVGVAQACLDETCLGIKDRIAIAGVKVAERPTVHVNLGQAASLINAARDTVYCACDETDMRIDAQITPSEGDYLRQVSAAMQALQLCDEAMRLLLRVLGGNGLREGTNFERRYRDFQAMPLHINAHRDRITEQMGRHVLGLETQNPF